MSITINDYIDFVLNKLISFYDPEKIYLFGSQARNQANKDSDIDFLIINESNKPKRIQTLEFRKELRSHNNYPIDLLIYTPQEFEEECDIKGTIAYHAKKEGEILYEKESTFIG